MAVLLALLGDITASILLVIPIGNSILEYPSKENLSVIDLIVGFIVSFIFLISSEAFPVILFLLYCA